MNEDEIKDMVEYCKYSDGCFDCPYNPEDNRSMYAMRWYGGCPDCDKELVRAMGKGYRKVADDEIVIKQTDYVELNKDFYDWKKEYDHNCLLRLEVFELEKQLEQAKQETREILQEVVNAWNTGNLNQRELAYICTKYGIELE